MAKEGIDPLKPHFRNEKATGTEIMSPNIFWDRYWGRTSQRLVNFFSPVPSYGPRSLCESKLFPVSFRSKVANYGATNQMQETNSLYISVASNTTILHQSVSESSPR